VPFITQTETTRAIIIGVFDSRSPADLGNKRSSERIRLQDEGKKIGDDGSRRFPINQTLDGSPRPTKKVRDPFPPPMTTDRGLPFLRKRA
jgi:hypothetical protein